MEHRLFLFKIVFLLCTLTVHNVNSQEKAIRLDPMLVNNKAVTLSGFSSGGTFAQQMHFSFAGDFSGIAVFSHTYYRCGIPNGIQADYDRVCTKLGNVTDDKLYNPNKALDDIASYFKSGLIEDPKKLRNKKLYVYTGLENFLFSPAMSLRILKVFEPFIQNPLRIKTVVQNAGTLMPTNNFGDNCTQDAEKNFFIGNCGYSGALDALQFLLSNENIQAPRSNIRLEKLQPFDQKEFFTKETHYMDEIGYIYIPKGCKNNGFISGQTQFPFRGRSPQYGFPSQCLLHFYFHGCFTGREKVQENHIKNIGFLEIAEANNIVVVFPQTVSSPGNEIGCWDTYGITGPQYATKKGAQVRVVKNMLSRILGSIQFPGEKPKREVFVPHFSFPWDMAFRRPPGPLRFPFAPGAP